MKIIEPAYQSVNLCFASNEKYAPHLATVLYSLLKNCDTKRMYDIIILHKDICREQQEKLSGTVGSLRQITHRGSSMRGNP